MPKVHHGRPPRFVMVALGALLCLLAGVAAAAERTVLVFGDSLSAAYNLRSEEGWVHRIGERLAPSGWRVVNASVSGETTAGGRVRLPAALERHRPAIVILELGANDALRGLPLSEAEANLSAMIEASQAAGAKVLLLGMRIPPNYGPDYAEAFHAMFATLAKRHGTALVPFLLEPIALRDEAFMPDRVHPTAAAQPELAAHVWPALAPLVEGEGPARAAAGAAR